METGAQAFFKPPEELKETEAMAELIQTSHKVGLSVKFHSPCWMD